MSAMSLDSPLDRFSVGSATIVKNIIKEVVRDCAKQDVFIDETVVSMVVRLLGLDPANGLQLDQNYDRLDLEAFVRNCVERLKDTSKPWIKALGMQVFFLEHSIDMDRIIQHHERTIRDKTSKLTQDILSAQSKLAADQEKLFKKITIDIIVHNILGSASNQELCSDISAALSSVLSKDQLVNFVSLKTEARLDLMQQYRQIVCGIYIFNKDSGLLGSETIDVPTVVLSGHTSIASQLNIALDEIESRIKLLTAVLDKHRVVFDQQESHLSMVNTCLGNLQDMLIMQKQHFMYVKSLIRSLVKTKTEIDQSVKAYKAKILLIRERVQYKTAISTAEIFPHFEDLSVCWLRLQNFVFIISEIKLVNERLIELNDEVQEWENTAMDMLSMPSDKPVQAVDGQQKIVSTNSNVEVIEHKPNLKIEFSGFCPVFLTKGDGYLQTADLTIGICVYKEKNFAFSSVLAAEYFLENPEILIFNVVATARSHPELILLLDIFDLVKTHRNDFHGLKRSTIQRATCDEMVQTDLHPETVQFDKNYMWNMWDYRRKAIQFGNMLNMQTSSGQTAVSYQRYDVDTQTWSPRERSEQTRRNNATMVPLPKRFVRGVRGSDAEQCRDVKLTPYVEDDVRTYETKFKN